MTVELAGQTVTFITVTGTGVYDADGMETMTETEVPVDGCRHRPLRAEEAPQWVTNLATQVWRTTAPAEAAALAATSNGLLKVDGVTYRIVGGAQPFTDMAGEPFKVTVLSTVENP